MSTQVDTKSPGQVLKGFTIASSLLLATGIISYRVGAFDSLLTTASADGLQAEPAAPVAQRPASGRLSLNPSFSSSAKPAAAKATTTVKTAASKPTAAKPATAKPSVAAADKPQPTSPSPARSPTFMAGSKSLGPIPVVPAPSQAQSQSQRPRQQASK